MLCERSGTGAERADWELGSFAKIDPRKVAEVVRGSRDKRSLQYSVIRSDIGSPIKISQGGEILAVWELPYKLNKNTTLTQL